MKRDKGIVKITYLTLFVVYFLLFIILVAIIPFIKLDSYLIIEPAKVTILQLLSGGVLYWKETGLAFMYYTDDVVVIMFIVLALIALLILLIKKRDFTSISITIFLFASLFFWLLSFNVNPYQTRLIMFVDNGSIITPAISVQITWVFFLIYFAFLLSFLGIIFLKCKMKLLKFEGVF